MSAREIVTLQFGHYSNFVGTHWWNTQERGFDYSGSKPSEISHDVLYREGLTLKGQVTYSPRLLLVDLKDSLKSLPERGDLYEQLPDPSKVKITWNNEAVEPMLNDKIEKNIFHKHLETQSDILNKKIYLENDIHVWSDFLYTRFHPRTANIIKQYEHGNVDIPFDIFPMGCKLWESHQFQDDFSDRLRNYLEECDNFQGFHVILDSTDGFSGLANACIQHLTDEYEHKSILAFPVIPSYYPDYSSTSDEERQKSAVKDSVRVLNLALTFDALAEHASLFVPLSTSVNGWRQLGPKREFNHLNYSHQLPYHSSAILASALDTFTLRHRLKSSQFSLNDLCADLNNCGRKLAAASVCLPFSLNEGADLIYCLDNWDGPLSQSLTPRCAIGTDKVMQVITLRGISEDRLKRPLELAQKQRDMPAYRCKSISEMLSFYLSCTCYASASSVTTVDKPLTVKSPFPNIFDQRVGVDGNITGHPRAEHLGVNSVPVLAGLHTSESIGPAIESLHTETRRIKFPRLHQFRNAGLEHDDFENCLDRLFDLRECYLENYEL